MDKALRLMMFENLKKSMMQFYKNNFDINYMLNRTSQNKLIDDKVFAYVSYPSFLSPIPIDVKKFEPLLSETLLNYHHKKYLGDCVSKYNQVVEKYFSSNTPGIEQKKLIKEINHYGGAIINHQIYWETLSEEKEPKDPDFDFFKLIQRDFGTKDKMIEQLKGICMDIKGYGWGWLGYDLSTNGLSLAYTPDEIPLQMHTGLLPIFGIDMWEHAFYLQYKNVKGDYLNAVISRLNWINGSENLKKYQTLAFELHSKLD